MLSKTAHALKMKSPPLCLVYSDIKPDDAIQFVPDKWACIVSLFKLAYEGKTVCFELGRHGCDMGAIGLCLSDQIKEPPGGLDYFLSYGRGEGFREGEYYVKTPEYARAFVNQLNPIKDPHKYLIVKNLSLLNDNEPEPKLISFWVNPDQLSALLMFSNYHNASIDNMIIPMGAGCHTLCLYPYQESMREHPRAVIGLTDCTCRKMVKPELLSVTIPWSMYLQFEETVEESFLSKEVWQELRERI